MSYLFGGTTSKFLVVVVGVGVQILECSFVGALATYPEIQSSKSIGTAEDSSRNSKLKSRDTKNSDFSEVDAQVGALATYPEIQESKSKQIESIGWQFFYFPSWQRKPVPLLGKHSSGTS